MRKTGILLASGMMSALATTASADADMISYRDLIIRFESSGNQYATNNLSSATGMHQFLYGTLRGMGFIESGPRSVPPGAGEWAGVVWSGMYGINSRQDFMNSMFAQDRALEIFTRQNHAQIRNIIASNPVINGIPMTDAGALAVTHKLGAGGFQQWASCGFQVHCLDPAWTSGMTLDGLQNHLMLRMAEGAGVDPSLIIMDGNYAGDSAVVPQTALMPWSPQWGPARISFARGS